MKTQKTKPVNHHEIRQKLKTAQRNITIKAENTTHEDWVHRSEVMSRFSFSARTMQYYHTKGYLPYSKIGTCILYYLPGILQILEQNLNYQPPKDNS